MDDLNFIEQFLRQPRESMAIELKDWVDPRTPEGVAKIIRACFAIYNIDGGWLLIGFNNNDGAPSIREAIDQARVVFHQDSIAQLISKYASKPFSVDVFFSEISGLTYPAIKIPSGVRSPVVLKSPIIDDQRKILLKEGIVYVRSLQSNGMISSGEARWKDWQDVAEVWGRNQQNNIIGFLRRLIADKEGRRVLSEALRSEEPNPAPQPCDASFSWMDEARDKFDRRLRSDNVNPPAHGAAEFSVLVTGELEQSRANVEFRRKLAAANPNLTGWPAWVDSEVFKNENDRPRVVDGAWEAFIYDPVGDWSAHVDFWVLDPTGRFYQRRALQDDIGGSSEKREPLKKFDPLLATIRVAEAVAVALRFSRVLTRDGQAVMAFAVRYSGLQGRELDSWADRRRFLLSGRRSYSEVAISCVEVPVGISDDQVAAYVEKLMAPIIEVFDGYTISSEVVTDLTERVLQRRL